MLKLHIFGIKIYFHTANKPVKQGKHHLWNYIYVFLITDVTSFSQIS
jgi:hypothetical protein